MLKNYRTNCRINVRMCFLVCDLYDEIYKKFLIKRSCNVFRYQLPKSTTSIDANLEESRSSNLKEFLKL